MQSIKFLHTADLHIDTPFKGLGHLPETLFDIIKNSTFQSFENLISHAIDKTVDFVIISGDLYDGANRSLRAQLFLKQQFKRLEQHDIDVYVIHGNHDHLSGEYVKLSWPDNLHFFGSSKPEMIPYKKDGKVLAHLYGYSYPSQSITENISSKYERVEGAQFHIALLHGTIGGNTDHHSYAPFVLNELKDQPFNYWALGHIHKREELSYDPYVIYPGNIQGLNRKERGPKGCYLIEMTEAETNHTFIDSAPVRWETCELSTENLNTMDELIQQLQLIKEQYRSTGLHTILSVELSAGSTIVQSLYENDTKDDLLDHLQEDEEDRGSFVWVHRLTIEPLQTELFKELGDSHFMKELLSVLDELDDVDSVLEPLTKHKRAKRYISNELIDKQEILNEAKHLLIESLALQSER